MKMNTIKTVSLFLLLSNISHADAFRKTKRNSKNKNKIEKVVHKAESLLEESSEEASGLLQDVTFPKLSFFQSKIEEPFSYEEKISKNSLITVENLSKGHVEVRSWEKTTGENKQPLMLITGTKKGTPEAIEATQIQIKHTKNGVKIATLNNDKNCTVDYTLLIHPECKLHVTTAHGEINIKDMREKVVAHSDQGNIRLSNVLLDKAEITSKKGNIFIAANTIKPGSEMFVFTEKGKIEFSVPKETDASLVAIAEKGKITSTVDITLDPHTLKFNNKTLAELQREARGTLGKQRSKENNGALAQIKLHSLHGNIDVLEV